MDGPEPAWHADPTGRYAQRWFDGTSWTASVADAAGRVLTDDGAPLAPPVPTSIPASASPTTPPTFGSTPVVPAPGPVIHGSARGPDRRGRWVVGVVLALLGAGVLAASLLSLDWFKDIQDHARPFSDADQLFEVGGSGATWTELYVDVGWIVGLVAVGAAVLVAATRSLALLRFVGGACLFGAVIHAASAANIATLLPGSGLNVLPGAWIGSAGYVLAGIGAVVAASSRP